MSKRNEIAKTYMDEFRKHFTAGIEGIVKASEAYVAAIDDNPRYGDEFRDEFADWVPHSAWSQFEAVGRKWLHPKLIMGGMSDRTKSGIVKKLPYSIQERVFDRERFDLLTHDGDTLQVDMIEATASQAKQLCAGNRIRTLSEQKAWIESQRVAEAAPVSEVMPYTIRDGKVAFRRGVTLTRTELKRLLQDM